MLRDKHKDRAYFEKRLNRIQKRLREDIETTQIGRASCRERV